MGTLQRLESWSSTHHPKWLEVLRVALGLALFFKGISFMNNAIIVEQLIAGTVVSASAEWIPFFITWLHLLGGFFILVGLFTRWAVLSQIPILVGAIIFLNGVRGPANSGPELGLAFAILLLLFFFMIEGGSPLSLDDFIRKNPR
ncbi:MAG: DoxX family protein [Chitinophagales bacterium]